MRYLDENMSAISADQIDLSIGSLIDVTVIRVDAKPIDNVKKHAWADDDYEPAKMYVLKKSDLEVMDFKEEIEGLKSENLQLRHQVDTLRNTVLNYI